MITTANPDVSTARRKSTIFYPLTAAAVGAASFGAALTAGDVLGLNADAAEAPATSWGEIAAYVGMALAAVGLATWLATRALAGPPQRLARYALGLAIGSALTFVAFWSGWPEVLGAVAVATAVEHRRRIGGFDGTAAAAGAVGGLSLVASLVVCVIG
jgi:hypothetical protein